MILLSAAFSPLSLHALTATEIIEASEQTMQGDSLIGIYEITIKTRRWERILRMSSYVKRKEKKSFTEILAPVKDRGNRFLLIEKNMWHFVPKLQQTIKISPSMMLQSWMGSDFTNDDIVKESSIVTDYTHHLIGREQVDGHECFKLELLPKLEAAVVWGKIHYYARTSDYLPVRIEYYNERSELKKHLSCSDFKFMHDRVVPTRYKMQTVKKEDRYTLMQLLAAQYDVPIPDTVFSIQNLKRR